MTSTTSVPSVAVQRSTSVVRSRWFYTVCSALLLGLTFAGFHRFFLRGTAYGGPPGDRPLTPPIKTVVITHGIVMSAWILLFMLQPLLIASRKYKLHMKLGWLGGLLALAVLVTGLMVGVGSARVTPTEVHIWGYTPHQFMIVPVMSVILFAGCVLAGIIYRKKPDIHKPLMLLSTLTIISAAVSRIETFNGWYYGTFWEQHFGPFFWSLLIGGVMVLAHWALTRRLNKVFAAGYVALVVVNVAMLKFCVTPAWEAIAQKVIDMGIF